MRSTVAVSLLVCLLAAFPAASATKRAVKPILPVYFNYTLFDTATQQPVIGAEVRSGTQSTTSDASGNFSLQVTPGRSTSITVHRTGYADLTFAVLIPSSEAGIPVSFPLPTIPVITFPNGAPPQNVSTGISL